MTGTEPRLVYVTCPGPDVAERIARALVERRLAACGNVLPGATSVYRWNGTIETAAETILILKTTLPRLPPAMEAIRSLHPHETPAILAFAPDAIDPRFAAWLDAETRPG
jgi:periplasmic divalent cation tolerance protein